eukprot:GGOE01004949.1.p2 GENE.GGOE01004949.1~~GGOE01004949.1.p2  ORF type:complete len:143 (+),score=1.16 GGOE01004949.1:352-780(+)
MGGLRLRPLHESILALPLVTFLLHLGDDEVQHELAHLVLLGLLRRALLRLQVNDLQLLIQRRAMCRCAGLGTEWSGGRLFRGPKTYCAGGSLGPQRPFSSVSFSLQPQWSHQPISVERFFSYNTGRLQFMLMLNGGVENRFD